LLFFFKVIAFLELPYHLFLSIDGLDALKHETDRWAVVEDVNCGRIAVASTSDVVWEQLEQPYENKL